MKDRKMTILVTVIILLLIGLSFAKSKGPQPVDWTPSFMNTKTAPYGTYIAYDLLTDIFEKKNIQTTRVPIYNNLKKINGKYIYYDEENNPSYYSNVYDAADDEYLYTEEILISDSLTLTNTATAIEIDSLDIAENEEDSIESETNPTSWYFDLDSITDTTSYLFVNMRFDIDDLDLEYLLDFVGLGNNAFISAEIFNNKLLDTLGIHRSYDYYRSDTVFSLPDYPSREYRIGTLSNTLALNTDSCPYPVRTLGVNNHNDTVFIDIQYGRGHIYLHTVPTAFTNINMLKTTEYDFAFRCLSYLPENSKIIWDEFQKQGMQGRNSYFRVLFANPPLRTALYIVLAGLLLFMIFRAKRTQRIIPVITPPVNSSLEFLGTISNLYYRKKDFTTIAQKRHAYFLDFIRKNYYMSTENTDSDFISRLSAKSGMDKEELSELFSLHKDITILPYVSNELFLKYNSLLEDFYKKAKNK
ncbi:DUF4350 domain-containing protein [Dysgonomonas sp. Marseille-P4361]|uniref:DUF4350 domain-containing protein n=1 Tax=Dysgonomonas sp. Marseille-P4361 TaxID=2161820 RepID=UPI000D561C65|nr:DUF4350 domain-containing protein [Dysgonomonas sp. Marseille-P4361]